MPGLCGRVLSFFRMLSATAMPWVSYRLQVGGCKWAWGSKSGGIRAHCYEFCQGPPGCFPSFSFLYIKSFFVFSLPLRPWPKVETFAWRTRVQPLLILLSVHGPCGDGTS